MTRLLYLFFILSSHTAIVLSSHTAIVLSSHTAIVLSSHTAIVLNRGHNKCKSAEMCKVLTGISDKEQTGG